MNFVIEKIKEKPDLYNNLRLTKYTPILPSYPIIIDTIWFKKQNKNFQSELYHKFPDLIFDEIELPHQEFKENNVYCDFLCLYKQQYLFDNYEYLFEDCYIIKLSCVEINELLGLIICFTHQKNYRLKDNDLIISDELYEKIKIQLDKCNYEKQGVFVKTSVKSAKHSIKLFPCHTVKDVLNNLIFSTQVTQSLLVDNCNIIMRKWNNNICLENEFRVFILDKEIKCISQQKLESLEIKITPDIIVNSICQMWDESKCSDKYNDCVIDCYIHDNIAHIIEINSGCAWSTSGAALFNWDEIIKLEKPVLKLLIK